ncbi:hypothetical protein ABEB36_006424 [Hypothenemus hampei]|uniref:Uncharacterized protein n=1 Tax=Hypothenemus hampei TaxID=57062 RepID=A0ABD1EQH1_HYPHA
MRDKLLMKKYFITAFTLILYIYSRNSKVVNYDKPSNGTKPRKLIHPRILIYLKVYATEAKRRFFLNRREILKTDPLQSRDPFICEATPETLTVLQTSIDSSKKEGKHPKETNKDSNT